MLSVLSARNLLLKVPFSPSSYWITVAESCEERLLPLGQHLIPDPMVLPELGGQHSLWNENLCLFLQVSKNLLEPTHPFTTLGIQTSIEIDYVVKPWEE